MATAADARHRYLHQAVIYDSEAEFLDTIAPFVTESVDAGEPIMLGLSNRTLDLLHGSCDLDNELIAVVNGSLYGNPVTTIDLWLRKFNGLAEEGATSFRAVGDVPHPGVGEAIDWPRWARYESIINRAFADLPLWGLCTYDARLTPGYVLDDVERTHPFVTTDGSHGPNPRYEDELDFLARLPRPTGVSDLRPPDHTLQDPTPAEARQRLDQIVGGITLDRDELADLHVAVSELVSNGHHHGDAPVSVSFWAEPDRVEIVVTDPGLGPADPFVGWIPPRDALATGGGRGLWLANQLAPVLDVWTDADGGFTARLTLLA